VKTRIVIVDDHTILREGLCSLINGQEDMEVVGEASQGVLGAELCREAQPDAVIVAVELPDMDGARAVSAMLADSPGTRALALSRHGDGRTAQAMLRAGARAYLVKQCSFGELAQAVRHVMAGQGYLSPQVAGLVADEYADRNRAAIPGIRALTARERDVLSCVAQGLTTREIAEYLRITVKTVETHRQNLMRKLGLHNVAALTRLAVHEGLVPPEM